MPWIERQIQRFPVLWKRLDMTGSYSLVDPYQLKDHAVIVGYGQIGQHLVDVLTSLEVTPIVIEMDSELVAELNEREVPVLYGDAANSEVIMHAGLRWAKVLVITIPDEPAVAMIITAARDINPDLPIIVRADTEEGMPSLARLGANHVIMPELEGSLEITQRTLLQLGYPLREVAEFIESRRRDFMTSGPDADLEYGSLRDLLLAYKGIEITWSPLEEGSPLIGQSIAEANLRAKTGASIIAIIRDSQLVANPKSSFVFMQGDLVGMIGEEKQLAAIAHLIRP
jgi:CPA2 family monovalent cation:H+ antiporter-2